MKKKSAANKVINIRPFSKFYFLTILISTIFINKNKVRVARIQRS